MTDQEQQTQSQTPMEGTSNPPNGGQVSDISNPEANDATVSQTSASNTPPPAGATQATPPSGVNSAPVQGNSANGPTPGPGKTDLSKNPAPGTQPAPVTPQGPPPAVQKASMFHEVAQALAGGPRFTYSVDEYGNMQKKPVPISTAHLGLAIALEALTGAAAGFSVPNGPGNLGKAAAAGFGEAQKQQKQITQQQKDEATQDFARKAQTTEMNMRLALNARQIGKMDEEQTDKYVDSYKDIADKIQSQYPGYILASGVSYKDLSKYHVTTDTAIPYKKVPRLDSTGKQAVIDGKPQWDINYMILKPEFKGAGLITQEGQKTLEKWGVPGMDNPNIQDTAMSARLGLGNMSLATHLATAEQAFDNIFSKVDEANKAGQSASAANLTQAGSLKAPEIKGKPQIQGMVDNAATKYAPSVKSVATPDNFQALLRGLVNQESGGNAGAKSVTGATGIGQFTTSTAKQYGLIDAQGNDFRTDPVKNADATAHYFSDLLNQYKDPKKALAAYYSGPGAISQTGQIQDTKDHSATDTQRYIDQVAGRVGLTSTGNADVATQAKHPSPTDWAKDHPTFAKDTAAFMGAYDAAGNNVDAALKHLQSSGQGDVASNISAYLKQYGDDTITTHDNYLTTQAEQRKAEVQTAEQEKRAGNKQAMDEAAHAKKEAMLGTLETAKIPDNSLQMDPKDVIKSLSDQGVTLPPEAIRDAMAIARYEAPINVASNKLWFKDQALTQQDLLDVVRQFNPAYNVDNYKDLHTFTTANSKPAQTFQAAAAVSNHLEMLTQLAAAVKSGAGQYPLINKLENELNYHTGGTDYSRLQALTGAVNDEMGKVLSGGFAPQKGQVEAIMNNMTAQNSEQQIDALARLYTGVMHGKVAPYDEQYNQMSGSADKHLQNIPASFTRLSQKYGQETPWDTKNQGHTPSQQMLPGQQNANEVPVRDQSGQVIGFTIPGAKGYRALQQQATQQQAQPTQTE